MSTPPILRVTRDSICPNVLDARVGKGRYYQSVANVIQRDVHPQHGGGIVMADAIKRANLFAHAEALEHCIRAVLPDLEHYANVTRHSGPDERLDELKRVLNSLDLENAK